MVWEPVLSLRLGSPAEHRDQLVHLRRCADLPCVTLQVLPLASPTHAGLDGPFILLETPEHHHLGYTESQRGSHLLREPDEVSILARKYAMLRTQALTAEDTTRLLDRLGD